MPPKRLSPSLCYSLPLTTRPRDLVLPKRRSVGYIVHPSTKRSQTVVNGMLRLKNMQKPQTRSIKVTVE